MKVASALPRAYITADSSTSRRPFAEGTKLDKTAGTCQTTEDKLIITEITQT